MSAFPFHTSGQWDKGPEQFYDNPMPPVLFAKRRFCLTGVFAFGERKDVERQITDRGGAIVRKPPQSGCYVVVGTLPVKEWTTSDAGRKILEAVELREQGWPVFVISEDYLMDAVLNTLPEVSQENDSFAKLLPPITFEQQMAYWFEPILKDFPSVALEIKKPQRYNYIDIHFTGEPKERLCRISNDEIAVLYGAKAYVGVNLRLSDDLQESLRTRIAELTTIVEAKRNAPPLPEKQLRLTLEEIQRRNTARKAAMRAKPVTQDVLDAARAIMDGLADKLSPGCSLQGQDRSKYYAIELLPKRQWICRLHYKTKNKYIELPGEDMTRVVNFENLDGFIATMATMITKV